jgi:dihydroneopterin aldolase
MTIHIEALTFDVIIGLLDFERDRPQKVIVDIEASYVYRDGDFIDYAVMVLRIKEELKAKRYTLLEDALLGVKSALIDAYPHIKTLSIKISKPDIITECNVALSDAWTL